MINSSIADNQIDDSNDTVLCHSLRNLHMKGVSYFYIPSKSDRHDLPDVPCSEHNYIYGRLWWEGKL